MTVSLADLPGRSHVVCLTSGEGLDWLSPDASPNGETDAGIVARRQPQPRIHSFRIGPSAQNDDANSFAPPLPARVKD